MFSELKYIVELTVVYFIGTDIFPTFIFGHNSEDKCPIYLTIS
jgi:hypothetical protein